MRQAQRRSPRGLGRRLSAVTATGAVLSGVCLAVIVGGAAPAGAACTPGTSASQSYGKSGSNYTATSTTCSTVPGGSQQTAYDPNAQICVYVSPPANQDPVYNTAKPPAGAAPGGQNMNELCGRAADVYAALGTADPSTMCQCTMIYGVWVNRPAPSPRQIAQTLVAQLGLTRPQIHTSPSAASHLLVGLPTWLWIDGNTADRHVTDPTGQVAIDARQSVAWSTDEGALPCSSAGTPYVAGRSDPKAASPDCGWTFRRAGGHTITADVRWTVTFSVGGAVQGQLAPTTWTLTQPVQVDEVQTVNGAG